MNKYLFSALVIDDNFEEIKDFMKILNHNGIATYYLNFVEDKIEDYSKNISNIRLIVTDLLNDATPHNTKLEEIIATFGLLEENKINNFLLIVWTKHKEKYDEFIKNLKQYYPKLNFISIPLNKEEFININKTEFIKDKYQELSEQVKSHIENNLFKHFLKWEANVGEKTYKILNELIENIENDYLKTLIATLTQEEKNNELKEKELFKILNTILSDEITSINTESINEDFNNIQSNETLKAKLNTVILFEKNPPNKISNGNIYLYENLKLQDNICYEEPKTKFSKDFYKHKPEEKITEDKIYFSCPTLRENYNSKNKLKKECKNFHKNRIIPILIDITPSCDIANNKFTKSRLLFGYLYENSLKCLLKAEYLYNPNFVFEYNNKLYKIIFSLKDLIAINPQYLQSINPILRARKELTADIQQKTASHIARIGVFSLEEKK